MYRGTEVREQGHISETESSGEMPKVGECGGRCDQRLGGVLCEGWPENGLFAVTINTTFHSQKGPRLGDKLHDHTTLRLVEVPGCQRKARSDLVAVSSRG